MDRWNVVRVDGNGDGNGGGNSELRIVFSKGDLPTVRRGKRREDKRRVRYGDFVGLLYRREEE